MKTQREFIIETLKQTLKPENIFKLNQIVDIAFKNINTNMTFDTIKDYIPYAVSFNTENLQTGVLPGTPELCNKVWIYTVNKRETVQIVEQLFKDQQEEKVENDTNSKETQKTFQKQQKY